MIMPEPEVSAAPFVPKAKDVDTLAAASKRCHGCPLYKDATQTVFGEGPRRAELMLVGEAPGDAEDKSGKPFVGPAGKLLDRALAEAGLDRSKVYVTNAVKHFKFRKMGRYRLHRSPGGREIRACRPWLEAELAVVRPKLVVCMGSTAAQAMAGRPVLLREKRGTLIPDRYRGLSFVTVHPSSILRSPEDEDRRREFKRFVADLKKARRAAERRTESETKKGAHAQTH